MTYLLGFHKSARAYARRHKLGNHRTGWRYVFDPKHIDGCKAGDRVVFLPGYNIMSGAEALTAILTMAVAAGIKPEKVELG